MSLPSLQDFGAESFLQFFKQHCTSSKRSDLVSPIDIDSALGLGHSSLKRDRGEACGADAQLVPVQSPALPGIDETDAEDRDEYQGFNESKHTELSQLHRPRIQEHHFHIEHQEQQCRQVEVNRETSPRRAARRVSAFESFALDLARPLGTNDLIDGNHNPGDNAGHNESHHHWKPNLHYTEPFKRLGSYHYPKRAAFSNQSLGILPPELAT